MTTPLMASSSSTPPAAAAASTTTSSAAGIAGRTNYAEWDRLATDLVSESDRLEQAEIAENNQAVGLDGKYARSAAEASEKTKLAKAKATKKQLETFQKREQAVLQTFAGLLGPVVNQEEEQETTKSTSSPTIVRLTRDRLEAGKRVVTLCDTAGKSSTTAGDDTIVLTADLNRLESQMAVPLNPAAKSYPEDAENNAQQQQQQRSIFGLIKVFLTNLHHCTIHIKCKIISGTVELHNCTNVVVKVAPTATVATIQADLSSDIVIKFDDAPSGQNVATSPDSRDWKYWGESADDRIFHAGVSNMKVQLVRNGVLEMEHECDYMKDGAKAVGNATPEEFQFVTSVLDDQLQTEQVIRAGSGSTGTQARAMTQRELQQEQERRAQAEKMAVAMAEDMIQIKDKDGNVLVQKTEPTATTTTTTTTDDAVVVEEEVVTDQVQDVIKECEQNKARGNEAFGAGEYGQAILLYSLAIDTAAQLQEQDDSSDDKNKNKLFAVDVVYANRAACFLKLGQHEKAHADAAAALKINPDNTKATFRAGLALHAMKQYYQALPILAKAHKMQPKNQQIDQALRFCEMRVQQDQRNRMQGS